MIEPGITWNLFLTAIIIPIGLFLLYTGIKRLLDKRDKAEASIQKLYETKADKTDVQELKTDIKDIQKDIKTLLGRR